MVPSLLPSALLEKVGWGFSLDHNNQYSGLDEIRVALGPLDLYLTSTLLIRLVHSQCSCS